MLRLVKPIAMCLVLCMYPAAAAFASQTCCEGDDWLKWSTETQTAYLTGLLFGSDRGFKRGCFEGLVQSSSTPPKISKVALFACLDKRPRYAKDIVSYVQRVTTFYQEYPKDRSLTIQEVFAEFSDDKDRTADQVHQRLVVEGKRD
jgi:hypothetical protein